MTPLILFYNLSNEKGKKIRLICLKLHIRIKQVDPVDYAKPIGMLAGIKDFPAPQDDAPQIQNGKHLRMRCLS